MIEQITDKIRAYAEDHSEDEPELLGQLHRETYQKVLNPQMLSGHLQGRMLSMLSHLIRPKTILEIGTYTGYSALCLAEGLRENGTLHTIDSNEELVDLQKKYFNRSPFADQIIAHNGKAADIIPALDTSFDLVFVDADKKNYSLYFDLIIDKINTGGLFISDNVLWYGKVVKPTKKGDEDTAHIKAFNQKLKADRRIENILLPIRDGILLSRKR